MHKTIQGFVLIDAPHSALNNAGADVGARTENTVAVKSIRKGRDVYPYVSAQAWRFWWRNTLESKFGWNLSPIVREKKVAFTSANPFICEDDDVFGYMRALKKSDGGTLTRLSPLKNSPLVSVAPANIVDDFGVMARHEGDPVPFEHQFYSTVLKGIFSLDLSAVGIFGATEKTGYKNLDEKYVQLEQISEAIESSGAVENGNNWELPKGERLKRSQDTLKALPFLYSTTKGTQHLTDVTPKVIVLAIVDGGNHLFMNISKEDSGASLNIEALRETLAQYSDVIRSTVWIGKQMGFQDALNPDLEELESVQFEDVTVKVATPREAIENFTNEIESTME